MASSQVVLKISNNSQDAIVSYTKALTSRFKSQYDIKTKLETIDKDVARENDKTIDKLRANLANMLGDANRIQNITVPIIKDQVDSWVGYMTEVFCSSTPLFPVVANEAYMDAALMMNTILDNQARKGRWKSEFIKFFKDCAKYDLGAIEVFWDKVNTAKVETDLEFSAKQGKPKNIIWEGNRIKRMDLYNTFWDTSVSPTEIAEYGEFVGYHDLISRNKLKQLVAQLGDDAIIKNIGKAFNSDTPMSFYYIPDINPNAFIRNNQVGSDSFNWAAWMGMTAQSDSKINYKGHYLLTKLYARILPSEFGIQAPQPNTPQVWLFWIVNLDTIIYAERQTNAHEMIPILFGNPNDEGYKYQSKSLADDMQPFQYVCSALMNSVLASRRRAISDRGLYNPAYVEEKVINNPSPTAKMPVKPSAYAGVPLNEIYWPVPFNDDQAGVALQEINNISMLADGVSGRNKAQRGQFVKGNKTKFEFNDVMQNADNKIKPAAIVMEDQVFTPLKLILGTNILQYQGAETIYNAEEDRVLEIDPVALRKAVWQFKITDGAIPASQEMHEDMWQVALQVFASSQQLAQEYKPGKVFSYMMKLKGADISQFEKSDQEIQYEQAVTTWQQTVLQAIKDNPELTPDKLPPQPTPEQFGVGNEQPKPDKTLIQAIAEAEGAHK